MKFLPIITAGAVGSVMAAASIMPASAAAEPVSYVLVAVESESTAPAEFEEPETSQEVTPEESSPDGADVVEAETPALEAEVVPQEAITEVELPVVPDVAVSEAAVTQAVETPVVEPIEILSALPAEEDLAAEATEVPAEVSVSQVAAPLDQQPTTQSALPSVQEAPAAVDLLTFQGSLPEAGNSSMTGPGAEGELLSVGEGVTQTAENDSQDTSPEPRPVDTIDPAEVNNGNDSSEPTTSDPEAEQGSESKQARDREVEAAESPADEPLSQTGSPAASIAIGGVLLLVVGITLVSWRSRGALLMRRR